MKASDVNSLVETGATNIELANITVQGLVPGQTELLISRTNFDDDAGYDIPHVTVNGNVTVGD